MTPTAFGKYLLLERIAVGGMAEVFLAKAFGIEGFERILAIKRILPQLAEDKAFIGMFIDEARIAGHLSHANITPIYELGKVGSAHYIAMEHVWGKDLLQMMNRFRRLRKRMPAPMVAFIGARMCEALDYAHHKRDEHDRPIGLIHRDVSPQNVLVSYEGAVKLIDFGVAKAKTRTTKTQAGVVKGKFGYMSPEQVKGKKIDHRADVFALGTCLYEMLTLERLFARDTDFATMEMIRKAKIPPPSERHRGLPAELDEVVMKALAKDPAKRYQSAAEVQEALTRVVLSMEPRFTTTSLSEWMTTAFAAEMAEEEARLEEYRAIKPPSEAVEGFDEATIVGSLAGRAADESWTDEPTQIFFSSENGVPETASVARPAPPLKEPPSNEPPSNEPPSGAPSPSVASDGVKPKGRAGWLSDGDALATAALERKPIAKSEPPRSPAPDPVEGNGGDGRTKGTPNGEPEVEEPPIPIERTPQLPRHPGKPATVRARIPIWQAIVVMVVSMILGAAITYLTLDLSRSAGRIEVHAYPDVRSRVRIDGVDRGAPPFFADSLPPGTYVVEVEAEGYRSVTRPVIVRRGNTVTIHVELAPEAE